MAISKEAFFTPIEGNKQFEPYSEILRFDPQKMWKIAKDIVEVSQEINENDHVLLVSHPGAKQLAQMIIYLAGEKSAAVHSHVVDLSIEASYLAGIQDNKLSPLTFEEAALPFLHEISWSNKIIFVRCTDDPSIYDKIDKTLKNKNDKANLPALEIRANRRHQTIIYIPSKAEAKKDNMKYDEYVGMFLRACDRPWKEIEATQQILIDEILNPGKEIEIIAGDTHLKMSIDGQTFANSVIKKNVPGAEIFSSPVRGTIEGKLVLNHPLMFAGMVLPDLKLVFEKGKIVHYETSDPEGMKHLDQVLDTSIPGNEGAREVGEIAFGTNRAFDRYLLNGLYIEKVGGSFHIAIGASYQFDNYLGTPVNLDNGVRAINHIDITKIMLSEFGGGEVKVDGKLIQKDGIFLDPRLAILNSK